MRLGIGVGGARRLVSEERREGEVVWFLGVVVVFVIGGGGSVDGRGRGGFVEKGQLRLLWCCHHRVFLVLHLRERQGRFLSACRSHTEVGLFRRCIERLD